MTRTMVSDQVRSLARARVVGQGARFVISGSVVALVYIVTTTFLAHVVGTHFQLALAIGYVVGLATHFTLQRLFVWSDENGFALRLHHQAARYLLAAAAQYGLTAAATTTLPNALNVPTEVVYILTVGVLAVANFVVLRTSIFYPRDSSP